MHHHPPSPRPPFPPVDSSIAWHLDCHMQRATGTRDVCNTFSDWSRYQGTNGIDQSETRNSRCLRIKMVAKPKDQSQRVQQNELLVPGRFIKSQRVIKGTEQLLIVSRACVFECMCEPWNTCGILQDSLLIGLAKDLQWTTMDFQNTVCIPTQIPSSSNFTLYLTLSFAQPSMNPTMNHIYKMCETSDSPCITPSNTQIPCSIQVTNI